MPHVDRPHAPRITIAKPKPPCAGAELASDGHWYVYDPKTGKSGRVVSTPNPPCPGARVAKNGFWYAPATSADEAESGEAFGSKWRRVDLGRS
jgi:hypothetical protein